MPRQSRTLAMLAIAAATALTFAPTARAQADSKPTPRAIQAVAGKIGMLVLEGPLRERAPELSYLFGSDEPSLRQVIQAIRDSAADDDLGQIVIRLKDATLSRTQVEELGSAMKAARATGKRFTVFSDSMGPTELTLGSYADQVLIQQGGAVSLPGLYMEEMFLADTLKWIGVTPDFVQIGDYKGANEMYMNTRPSPAWDQNINQLLDSLYGNLRGELLQGRGLNDQRLDDAMKKLWMADAKDAVSTGLADAAVDLPQLGETITGEKSPKWHEIEAAKASKFSMDTSNPFAAMSMFGQMFSKKPPTKAKEPTIAVLHIDGTIIDGESKQGGFSGGTSVGSRTVRNAIEDIRGQDLIKGVVVRINSPGGSAIASEIMWQGLRRLAEKKPVWVSVGSMAASGGYYLAVAGDKVYVNPSSIVGSIGVVGGKLAMGGAFDKVKLNVVGRGRGPLADMFNSTKPWSDDQRALVRAKMTETYELFTSRVTAGRKGIDLKKTAEGRLFTGDKAIALNMADKVGGLEDAIADLAKDRNLGDEYAVMDFPAPRPFDEVLKDVLGGFGVSAPFSSSITTTASANAVPQQLISTLRTIVGDRAWPVVARSLDALMVLRDEPVALTLPSAFIIR